MRPVKVQKPFLGMPAPSPAERARLDERRRLERLLDAKGLGYPTDPDELRVAVWQTCADMDQVIVALRNLGVIGADVPRKVAWARLHAWSKACAKKGVRLKPLSRRRLGADPDKLARMRKIASELS